MWRLLTTRCQGRPVKVGNWPAHFTIKNSFTQRISPKHHYSTRFGKPPPQPQDQLPPVRIRGPILWSIAAVATIYVGSAAYEVYHDAQAFRAADEGGRVLSLDALDSFKSQIATRPDGEIPHNPEIFSPITLAVLASVAIFVASRVSPRLGFHLLHTPVGPRNYTLLTSMFGHEGAIGLAIGMLCLIAALSATAGWLDPRRPEGSAAHLGAFFYSSGVIASLGAHLHSAWPGQLRRFSPIMGTGGAFQAALAAILAGNPDQTDRFLSFELTARDLLILLFCTETYLVLRPAPFWAMGASQLAGLCFGAGYVSLDGADRMWGRARRVAFSGMKTLRMV